MTTQENVECVICLEPLTSQTIWGCCRQPCYQQCVNQWKNTCHTISCPYCRQMIPIVVLDHRYNESWKKDKEFVKKVKQGPERHGSPHIGQERHASPHIRH